MSLLTVPEKFEDIVGLVLLRLRIGEYAILNLNILDRYSASLLRCRICNHVFRSDPNVDRGVVATIGHQRLHLAQVRFALGSHKGTEPSWNYTEVTPTREEAEATQNALRKEVKHMELFE